ncbi:uncharacterized protein [Rutidosis leptorrhynchoides]|uniref:uncharacterized protein n=1 Tax=Rutidosis leptorrhynchoides TaxID=125765 RepID=UPI003A98DADF
MADQSTKYHPALTISNIKNLIPITLEIENGQYNSWAELFKIHCTAYDVLDHIIPPTTTDDSTTSSDQTTNNRSPLWNRLDAIVKQWIYSTISNDLLHTILENNTTAASTWERLEGIFHDNKTSRALYLNRQFTNIKLDNFANCSAYCQEIKSLADQLGNVGDKVSDSRMNPKHKQTLQSSESANTAVTTTNQPPNTPPIGQSPYGNNSGGRGFNNRGRGNTRGRGRGNGRGRGRHQYPGFHQWTGYPPYNWQANTYSPPPCPYPTSSWARPNTIPNQIGILGPRPAQAHSAHVSNNTTDFYPTDLASAMHTMTLNPPDENWYMDTGATSHMTTSSGKLKTYFPLSSHKQIIVGNGNGIPINGFGNSLIHTKTRPIYLQNVLHAPKLIKNLISVRRLSIDNNISLEFDPFGFTVKEYPKGTPILRCDSTGELYPITNSLLRQLKSSPSTFAAFSSDVWHHRLGHPGDNVLRSLRNKNLIQCNKSNTNLSPSPSSNSPPSSPTNQSPLVMPCNNTNSASVIPPTNTSSTRTSPTVSSTQQTTINSNSQPTVSSTQPTTITSNSQPTVSQPRTIITRSMTGISKPKNPFNLSVSTSISPIPLTPKQALSDPNWSHAMTDEYQALMENNTWVLVPKTDDMKVIRSMWIYKHKLKSDGSLEQYKARLVGDGRTQTIGIDCNDTFSPVVKPSTIRIILSLALSQSWAINQLDVKNAFLHDNLNETIYMHQPYGFRDMSKPNHVCLLKRSLYGLKQAPHAWYQRYIQGTSSFGLQLTKLPTNSLVSYTDADWGGCPDTRRSTSGYCVFLGNNLISWSSKRQPTVSRSSSEAEYRGVANVVSESCWVRNLLLELHVPISKATIVFCDNVSAMYMSGNPIQHQRTKHIEMDIHFVREKVARGLVRVLHIPTRFQIADIFTKGLPRLLFEEFRTSLSVRPPPAPTEGVY